MDIQYNTPVTQYTGTLQGSYKGDLPPATSEYTKLIKSILEGSEMPVPHSEILKNIYKLFGGDIDVNPPKSRLSQLLQYGIYADRYTITDKTDNSITIYDSETSESKTLYFDDSLEAIWADIIKEYGYNTIVGTVPMTFKSSAEFINQYQIWGNIQQNGTPAPENPVEVQGVGKLVTEGEYSGKYEIPVVTRSENQEPVTTSIFLDKPLYKGDYIIKDKSGGKVHRKWGVKVFEGTENWRLWEAGFSTTERFYCNIFNPADNTQLIVSLCSHFRYYGYNSDFEHFRFSNTGAIHNQIVIYIKKDMANNVDSVKNWLKQQYDAGTPVTVYYPLATPTEEEIELPDIPTIKGWNIVDVATDVKLEKISLTYRR